MKSVITFGQWQLFFYAMNDLIFTQRIFDNLALIVPDTSYYIVRPRGQEESLVIIFPFAEDELKIDAFQSKYKARIYQYDDRDTAVTAHVEDVYYVEYTDMAKHIGKIRTGYIDMRPLIFSRLAHTMIFFEEYVHYIPPDIPEIPDHLVTE